MKTNTLSPDVLHKMDAYWRAANHLSVGQIYLYDHPLLKRPLAPADVKHMLLGHWDTTPGHASPDCPGSIYEGGELGYSLRHSFGAAFDNPDLIVACVVERRQCINKRGRDRPEIRKWKWLGGHRDGSATN